MKPNTETRINITDMGGLQAALDALPKHGGTVFIPAGKHKIERPVTKTLAEGQHFFIVGEGRGSVLVNTNTNGEPLAIRAPGCLVEHNLTT